MIPWTPERRSPTASVAYFFAWLALLLPLALQAIGSIAEAHDGASASKTLETKASRVAYLDPTFGEAGRVIFPPQIRGKTVPALMRDDSLVIGMGQSLVRLTVSGRRDESFGDHGTLTPPPPPGGSFQIEDLAVDEDNRLIVAGTAKLAPDDQGLSVESGIETPERPRAVRVVRYLPDGEIDPSFGEGGVAETDFGLPRPVDEDGAYLLTKPWLEATGVAVDQEGRVVLTGGASAGIWFGCFHDWNFNTLTYAAFVARLTEDGRPDPSFGGGDGIFGAHRTGENPLGAEFSAAPLVGPDASITYASDIGRCPANEGSAGLARLTSSGKPVESFGESGAIRWGVTAAAVRPNRSTVALGWVSPWYFPKEPLRAIVTRFGSQGDVDRSYGRRGRTVVTSPGGPASALDTLAVDRRGRVLLGGTMFSARQFRDPADKRMRRRSLFVLVRLGAGGRLDRTFGPQGRVATRFGSLAVHQFGLLLDSQGRAVMVGGYRGAGQTRGLAVARYVVDR